MTRCNMLERFVFVWPVVWLLNFHILTVLSLHKVSPTNTLVWGPAFETHVVVPVRYFFIQAADVKGENITSSIGDKPFSVHISETGNEKSVRIWLDQLDRGDGSYIIRFKLYQDHPGLKISILYDGKHVAKSPYTVKGRIYQEKCYCPQKNIEKWLQKMHCPHTYAQIQRDLENIGDNIDMDKVSTEAFSRFANKGAHSLAHYAIVNNKVYRRTHGQHVGFTMFMDAVLLSLARKVSLPDVEFLLNLGDWPLEKRKANQNPLPIFSWCGSDDTLDIIMPTYDVTESTLESLGRVSLDLMSVQGNTGPQWHEKLPMGFWRGRDSRRERLYLIDIARKNPDLLDASLTNFFFFRDEEHKYGPKTKAVSFFDFFKYKYQINIDGTVAAYRFPYLLSGDSVVLKQDSTYYEHFYKDLKPWKHYIPFKADMSDIVEKLQWAKNHDAEAKSISKNGREYAREYLQPNHIFCYHVALFQAYSKKLSRAAQLHQDMEVVDQPSDKESQCDCKRLRKVKRDEL